MIARLGVGGCHQPHLHPGVEGMEEWEGVALVTGHQTGHRSWGRDEPATSWLLRSLGLFHPAGAFGVPDDSPLPVPPHLPPRFSV